MLKSILFIVLATMMCALTAGCMASVDRGPIAWVPRYYPYTPSVPQLGPADGSSPSDKK